LVIQLCPSVPRGFSALAIPALPEIVRHPEGESEPFQPERITRSLFKAAESIGNNNPFLAQELTDGILHFLALEGEGDDSTPDQIAELVAKVVRELGFPDLARAYEQRHSVPISPDESPLPKQPDWLSAKTAPLELRDRAAAAWLTQYSLESLFPRELVCAHQEGLIRLGGLASPFEMAGVILPEGDDLQKRFLQARGIAGEFVVIDGPEYDLEQQSGSPEKLAREFWSGVQRGSEQTGLIAVVNLHSNDPPHQYLSAGGPLFGRSEENESSVRRIQILESLIDFLPDEPIRLFWHLSEVIENESLAIRLIDKIRRDSLSVEFVLDRPKEEMVTGPGMDRSVPGVLQQIGINLVRLLEQMDAPVDPELFLKKVGSLARFAKTAGHVKQDYLRQHGRREIRDAFLLERSRILLIPEGLAEVSAATSLPAVEFGRQILQTIRQSLESDRPRIIPFQIDSPLNRWGLIAPTRELLTAKGWKKGVSSWHEIAGGGAFQVGFESDSSTDIAAVLSGFLGGNGCRVRLFADKSTNWRLQ
jgi:hypothetical protein